MNKKLEPPKKTLSEVRIKKDIAPGSLVPIEEIDYLLDNLIKSKKKKGGSDTIGSIITEDKIEEESSEKETNSTQSTNPTTPSTTNVKPTDNETKVKISDKDDKKHLKDDINADEPNKKVKVEEKKSETKKPKRKKVFQACVVCRKSHISCDNKRPCTRCVKKGIAHLCHDAPKKGSNMMDCNSCPIFPLLKGPYPFQPNLYKPPPFPIYSTSILNSQLNPSPLTNFPIPLLNHQKLGTYPPSNGVPSSFNGLNTATLLQQPQILNQKRNNQPLSNNTQSLQNSLQTLKQAIQKQQDLQSTHPTPTLSQQSTPPLTTGMTSLSSLTSNAINNTAIGTTFPLTTANIASTQTLPLVNDTSVSIQPSSQSFSHRNSIHTPPTATLPPSLVSPMNTDTSPVLQSTISSLQQALQTSVTSTSPVMTSITATNKSQSQSQSQSHPITTHDLTSSTTISDVNSMSSNTATTTAVNLEQNASAINFDELLNSIESPHYALPNLVFNPSKPCVPFSSVTPIFSSEYMNNEFSALVNFCQNVSHGNDMPSRCKNCPFSRTEQFFLKAADNSNPNISLEDQLVDIIKEKYRAGLLKPYNYSKGYLRLQKFLDENISIVNKQRILNAFNTFQKGFKNAATNITDWDLLSSEESFERLLLEYDRVFASVGIPSCLWRRTGEIFKANRHFAYLVGVPVEELNNGKMSIFEFMTEDFVANYWEKYSMIAFDTKQKAVITSCVLENPQSFKRSIKCAFSFTIRRDKFEIPSAIIGNFMPYNPQLIYKDPFSTSSLGILGFLSPYSTPSYSPLPRGETGYRGCGCTNTQCCSSLKKEVKPKSTGDYHDHDYHYHDHDHDHDQGSHDNDHSNNYSDSTRNNNGNSASNNNNNNNNNSQTNSNIYTQNYNSSVLNNTSSTVMNDTNNNTYTNTNLNINNKNSSVYPKDTKENSYCSQCERRATCTRSKSSCESSPTSSCGGNHCSCDEDANKVHSNIPKTTSLSSKTSPHMNDPVMNEFMNLDMNLSENTLNSTSSSMSNSTAHSFANSPMIQTPANTMNNFINNFSSSSLIPLQEAIANNTTKIQQNQKQQIQQQQQQQLQQQQLQQQQLQQLQKILQQKIMNQNKDNNLPQLPINDIRNELPEELFYSILNN